MNAVSRPPGGLAAYAAVTAAYWAFMLSDGALRMLVLLHFDSLGFSPLQLAWLFLLYELAGIITNLAAGWIAARFGLALTLYAGLALQIVALVALALLNPGWGITASVAFVMAVQGLSGVAKDLTKMSSKSAVKLLAPGTGAGLFRWVAVLTGSKNAVKGAGFFLGAALLATLGFTAAIWAMAAVLAVVLLAVAGFLPEGLPRGRKGVPFGDIFARDQRINRLSAARLFLFGARDVWFVVGVPIYFGAAFSDGTVAGHGRAFFLVGGFMAVWVMLYGAVQALAPRLIGGVTAGDEGRMARRNVLILAVIPLILAAITLAAGGVSNWLTGVLVLGLLGFGYVFALNSALHSYLILAFARQDRVTMDVGFYYMSNAAGRLLGTLLSGVSYQLGGLPLCLATAAAMAGLSSLFLRRL